MKRVNEQETHYFSQIMKLLCLFLFLSIGLCACEKFSLEEEITDETKSGINVKCKITTVSMDSRASQLKDIVKRLAWAILDENGKLVKIGEQTKTNSSFGNLSIDLNPGAYNLVLFAYDSNEGCTISDGGIVTLENNKASDSFSAAKKITVAKSKRKDLSLVLARCVAKFQVNSTDVVPDNVSKLQATMTNISLGYNILDSIGTDIADMERPITQLGSQQIGKTFNGYIYTFLPDDSAQVSVHLKFLDEGNNVVFSHNFESFQMKVNYVSTYKGPLFVNSGADIPGITVDDEWGGQIPIEYP